MIGNLADLAATGIASEPTLRKWLEAEPDREWIIRRGSRGDAYEINIEAAVEAYRARKEVEAEAERQRAASIQQLRMEVLGTTSSDQQQDASLSIAERRQLLEEEVIAIKLAKLRGELVSFESAAAAFGEVLIQFRQRGTTFAARLAKKIDLSREAIAAIEKLVAADQADLARMMENWGNSVGDSSDHSSATLEDTAA